MRIERLGLLSSLILFGIPALGLWFTTHHLLPALLGIGWHPLLAWFVAGSLVFAPLFFAALAGAWLLLDRPTATTILAHLRVRPLQDRDWRIVAVAFVLMLVAVAAFQVFNFLVWPGLPPHPEFLQVEPLRRGEHYILAFWIPFFLFNIIGEELWWRGFIQPRQEPVFGPATWIIQGILHGLFHISFGLGVFFALIPVFFAIPWAVQRTRNTSAGIVLHAAINGPAFLAVTLGLLPV